MASVDMTSDEFIKSLWSELDPDIDLDEELGIEE